MRNFKHYVIATNNRRCVPNWNGAPNESLWKMMDNMKSVIFILIPFIVILTTTIWMLKFLKKVDTLRPQNIPLVLSVAILHLVSFVPFLLYVVSMNILNPPPQVKYRGDKVAQLYATAVYLNYLNTMSNPVLYYFTSASFKKYVRRSLRNLWSRDQERGSVFELNTVSSEKSGKSGAVTNNT